MHKPSDTDCIREKLLRAVPLRVVFDAEQNPNAPNKYAPQYEVEFGSEYDYHHERQWFVIELEDETWPRSPLFGTWRAGEHEIDLKFSDFQKFKNCGERTLHAYVEVVAHRVGGVDVF